MEDKKSRLRDVRKELKEVREATKHLEAMTFDQMREHGPMGARRAALCLEEKRLFEDLGITKQGQYQMNFSEIDGHIEAQQ